MKRPPHRRDAEGDRAVRRRQRPLDGRHDLGGHAAQPASPREDQLDRDRRGAGHRRGPRRADPRRRPRPERLRPGAGRPAGPGRPRPPLPGRAGRPGRCGPPPDPPPGGPKDPGAGRGPGPRAPGGEDSSMQVRAGMLALHTGKPVKMVYNREESFFGLVHRHPAEMRYEHGATSDGRLVYVKAEIYLDGGAYTSSTPAVVGNAGTMGIGPYVVPNVQVDAFGVYTNNPPCGAMRGFGSVQAAFGYEAQMDKLAAALGLDPVEVRCRNAMSQGSEAPTGQVVDSPAPVAELLSRLREMPLPRETPPPANGRGAADLRDLPGGVSNTTHGEGVVRGVGYAVAYKNVGFSEGYDDYSTARVRLEVTGGEPMVTVHTAAADVGQGLVNIEQQICRTELAVDHVRLHPTDTTVRAAGSTSASRQTYVTGGAVKAACERVRDRVLGLARRGLGRTATGPRLAGGSG